MSKFWTVSVSVLVIAVISLIQPAGSDIEVLDLETECSYRASNFQDIGIGDSKLK